MFECLAVSHSDYNYLTTTNLPRAQQRQQPYEGDAAKHFQALKVVHVRLVDGKQKANGQQAAVVVAQEVRQASVFGSWIQFVPCPIKQKSPQQGDAQVGEDEEADDDSKRVKRVGGAVDGSVHSQIPFTTTTVMVVMVMMVMARGGGGVFKKKQATHQRQHQRQH